MKKEIILLCAKYDTISEENTKHLPDEVISHLIEDEMMHQKLQQHIKQIGDLERLISKTATGKIQRFKLRASEDV